ncbi:MAG: hypothetical protein KDE51_10530, partial [Anaerolineales bacterium]|nr:hypothetical protein [Anaerolineales bacterium]
FTLPTSATSLSFSPAADLLMLNHSDGQVRIFDTDFSLLKEIGEQANTGYAVWSFDGQQIATINREGNVTLYVVLDVAGE